MKKIFFAIVTTISAFSFQNEGIIPSALPLLPVEKMVKDGFFYVRFLTAESDLMRMSEILPGLGIGYRRLAGDGAADISINGIGHAERKKDQILWSAPKASYIHYLNPKGEKSAYVGGGLAWGGVDADELDFIGIIPSVTFGYEFLHRTSVLAFTELNISQPAIAVYRKGHHPGPIAEIAAGVGF